MLKFTGNLPALLTPFDEQGEVNTNTIREMVEFQLDSGMVGFYLTGSTGEGLLLSRAERRLVVETVIDQVKGRVPVMVHIGAMSTKEACALAADAEEAGADAISSIPPIYFPVGTQGVKLYYTQVAQTCQLPLYVYNVPGATGVNVSVDMMRDLMDAIPSLHGLKYTSYNFFEMRKVIELDNGRLNVLSGPDEMMIAALAMGAHGAIGSTQNVLPHMFVQAQDAFTARDIATAQALQAKINWVVSIFLQFPALSALKEIMNMLGFDCGSARPPNLALTDEQKGRLREMLEEVGFFEFATSK